VGVAAAAEPVNITYGYHPYWTGGWNGVIIKAKELWKKHLPPGSTGCRLRIRRRWSQ